MYLLQGVIGSLSRLSVSFVAGQSSKSFRHHGRSRTHAAFPESRGSSRGQPDSRSLVDEDQDGEELFWPEPQQRNTLIYCQSV